MRDVGAEHDSQAMTAAAMPNQPTVERASLDLPGFCGERLAHFPGFSLEGDWALEAER